VELEAAADYRTDFELNKYCQADAKQHCPDVEPGDGRVQDCLVRSSVVSRPLLLVHVLDSRLRDLRTHMAARRSHARSQLRRPHPRRPCLHQDVAHVPQAAVQSVCCWD